MVQKTDISLFDEKAADEKAACNIIHARRRYDRLNIVHKGIYVPLCKVAGYSLSAPLFVKFNRKTDIYSISSHGLKWGRCIFYPTTNQKLHCINPHTMDLLDKQRKLSALRGSAPRQFKFSGTPGKNTIHYEKIIYNPNTRNISVTCYFAASKGHKLPVIDIE